MMQIRLAFAIFAMATFATAYETTVDSLKADSVAGVTADSTKNRTQTRPSMVRTYHPSKESQDAARKSQNRLYVPGLTSSDRSVQQAHKDRGQYLRMAGYHWLISLGLAATGTAWGTFAEWEPGVNRKIAFGLLIGAAGLQVIVPIDLILAGNAKD